MKLSKTGKVVKNWGKLIRFPVVFLLCSVFFLAGLFASTFLSISHDMPSLRSPPRLLKSMDEEQPDNFLTHGEDDSLKKQLDDDENVDTFKKPRGNIDVNDLNGSVIAHGLTGESKVDFIPFQVLSWKPRALFFHNFATEDQCQKIIDMAKTRLKPSSLALRKGETAESTKGVRTSSGTFLSALDDSSGVLEAIEHKIARATMIPRSHGEVNSEIVSE